MNIGALAGAAGVSRDTPHKVAVIDQRIAELQALRQELLRRAAQPCPLSRDAGS